MASVISVSESYIQVWRAAEDWLPLMATDGL